MVVLCKIIICPLFGVPFPCFHSRGSELSWSLSKSCVIPGPLDSCDGGFNFQLDLDLSAFLYPRSEPQALEASKTQRAMCQASP